MSQRLALALLATVAACAPGTSGPDSGVDRPDAGVDAGELDAGTADAGEDPNDPAPLFTSAQRAALEALSPQALPGPVVDVSNAFGDSAAAARLGQRFFFDPGFSGALLDGDNDGSPETLGRVGETGKVSCAGCHVADAGFSDARTLGHQISLAAGWGLRRTPSLLDVGQAKLLMWDGSRDALFNQVFGPIESRDEMNSSLLFVAEQVFARYRAEYEAVFGPMPALDDAKRFPQLTAATTGCRKLTPKTYECHGNPGDGAEFDGLAAADRQAVLRVVVNLGKAIAAYERRLTCGQGRFDRWMHGDAAALSRAEQRGAALFVGKGQCATCHAGPFFSDQKFHNVGLKAETVAVVFLDADDPGAVAGLPKAIASPVNTRSAFSDGDDARLPSSVAPELAGAFRTPTLRCASSRPAFMHTGQLRTITQVIDFFDRGGDPGGYPGTNELHALGLSERERSDLAAFLQTLEGPGPAAGLLGPP
ncbi:MAG: hypothetical protein K1X89_12530 [Myxococcaceae bacterium]|nr:hypothetical protein [Myxococcaceae bacterium]